MQELIYGDELELGVERDLGSHTVTEEELLDFGRRWDPLPFHTQPDVAEQGPFGGLITSGVHTVAILQKLAVEAEYSRWAILAGREIRAVKLLRPVRVGDTLTGRLTPVSRTVLDRGRVDILIEAHLRNQEGKDVLSIDIEIVLLARP
ncbi:MAG: MaoC/PaaZ C-terminal domain-containing protein [Mobilicoccus sp.]|nr:MaoC/PaaZ C-terminal domain-containing protein [Mobilicoccus sp.]